MTKKADTPFLRFRHGTPLHITADVKKSISEFLEEYRTNGIDAFKNIVKDIGDGSGWGIHPDSTWHRSIQELFELYRELDGQQQQEVHAVLIEILEKLAEDKPIEEIWNNILPIIGDNIEKLSAWEYYHRSRFDEKVKRDNDGTYYTIENGKKVQVIGTKTLEENKYGFISDDIERDYGKVGCLLKFVEIVAISSIYKNSPSFFKKEVLFTMNEADYSTWFLHGRWRVQSSRDLIPLHWHPRSCFTDIAWLKSEVLGELAKKCNVEKDAIPEINPTSDNILLFEDAFKSYPLELDIALETDILLGGDPLGTTPPEVYIEFEGRKLRWINGTKYIYPTLIIPTKDPTYEEEYQIAQRFINELIFSESVSVKIITAGGCPKKYHPLVRQPRLAAFFGISDQIFPLLKNQRSQKELQALAFYKQGMNADNPYDKYTWLYKIISLAFINPVTQEEDKTAVKNLVNWVDQEAPTLNISPDVSSALSSSKTTLGNYLRHAGGRNALQHVGILSDGKIPTIEPDKLEDRRKIQNLIPIVQELSNRVISKGMLK